MKQLLVNLLSRKFLLTLGTDLVLYAHGDYLGIVTVTLAYLGVNAAITASANYTNSNTTTTK